MIVKAIFLIGVELIAYWMIGTLTDSFILPQKRSRMGMRMVKGFLCYQILFQVCALPFILLKRSLTELTISWTIVIVMLVIAAILRVRKGMLEDIKAFIMLIKQHRVSCLVGITAVAVFCYYVSTNGILDEDSLYYIGLVNTTLETDTMFQYNVYTGNYMPSLYLRRILVTFEINAAVLAKAFGIEPIVVMRLFRSCMNVILSAIVIYSIGTFVYKKKSPTDCEKKSIAFTILTLYSSFLMDNTIFMNATFLLHRAYEGKAYAASVLILSLTYLCLEIMIEKQKKNYIWLFLLMWASAAVSTSAIVVNFTAIMIWQLAYRLMQWINRKSNTVESKHARG